MAARKRTDNVEPEIVENSDAEPVETVEATVRRSKVKAEDGVLVSDGFILERPPATIVSRTYVPSIYDEALADLWRAYTEKGSPDWEKYRDEAPYLSAIVADLDVAYSLIKRAARQQGISYRVKDELLEDGSVKIYFTAAPPVQKKAPNPDQIGEPTTDVIENVPAN